MTLMSNEEILNKFIKATNFQFPINESPYKQELKKWIKNYNDNIKIINIIKTETKEKIINFGNNLLMVLEEISYEKAFENFCNLMDKNKEIFPFSYLGQRYNYMCLNEEYYRITIPFTITYESMLHKPFENNPKRFTASDFAISYMSTSKELCWYECNRPDEYYVAKFNVKNYNRENQKLLRLDINSVSAHNEIRRLMCERNNFILYIEKYLMIFPLIAACSFVDNSKEKYEYIIPNLLMDWIAKDNKYIGIRYFSDSKDIMARNKCEHNIVLIARNPDENGISKDLCHIFDIKNSGKLEHIINNRRVN